MTIRSMAQSQLINGGFNIRGSSAPPAWQGGVNSQTRQMENMHASNATIRNAGRAMQDAFENITGRGSAMNALEGQSSDRDVATVRVDNSRVIASMPPQAASIDVRQVATAQTNEGTALAADERAVNAGSYSFTVQSGGRNHTFTMSVSDTDDNATIQRRMADAINARDIGVKASVEREGKGDDATSRLTLTASETGTGNTFSVSDAFAGGNLASAMGITAVTTEAQNAVYSLNGGFERTSQSNEVNIGSGVTAVLRGEGTTDISFARSTQHAVDAATQLVNSINSALRNTNVTDGRGSERFFRDIQGMNHTFASSLSRVGIDVQDNGRLSIDQDRLQRAAEDGSLSRMFESNTGFAGRAGRVASNAASGGYRNSLAPVNAVNPMNNFNFGNADNMWSMLNLFM